MPRANGARTQMRVKFEETAGTIPTGNWLSMPLASNDLSEEQGLLESDLLGLDREMQDPTADVSTDAGDIAVPVDFRRFGVWLKLLFGAPTTGAGDAATGTITFSAQPAPDSTITINGVAFTFKASGASGNQINIGADLATTIGNIVTKLNGSADTAVDDATYSGSATVLTITNDTAGVAGNTFTLAAGTGSNGTVSGATLAGGNYAHVFTTGKADLPSLSIEIWQPEIPESVVHNLVRGGTMRISLSRRGLLNATIGLIARGEDRKPASRAGTPTSVGITRFAQRTGDIKLDGVALAGVIDAEVSHSNNLEPIESVRSDGKIEDADPGMSVITARVRVRYATTALKDKAEAGTPVAATFGWTLPGGSLLFSMPRAFLPKPKHSVSGPGGIMADYQLQASGAGARAGTITLKNDVESY